MTSAERRRPARFCEASLGEIQERVDEAGRRFVDVARGVDATAAVPGLAWNAAELTAHVLTVVWRYTRRDPGLRDGLAATVEEIGALNEAEMAAVDRSHLETVEVIRDELSVLRSRFPETDPLQRFPFHAGATIDAAGAGGNLLGELLIHGRDLARARGEDWPFDDRDAAIALDGWLQVLPTFIDPDQAARTPLAVELRISGAPPWMIVAGDGVAESRPAREGDQPDAIIRTPASTMALVAMSRISPVQGIRRGMRITGGRRPWRVRAMTRLMPSI